MPIYPPETSDAIREPKFCRPVSGSNASGSEAKFDCGCFVRVEMRIASEDLKIADVGYRTNGCGYILAAAESLSRRLFNRSLLDLNGDLETQITGRVNCSKSVVRAMQRALAGYRESRLEEFHGEKALLCTCFGISEESVEHFITSANAQSVAEVSDVLRAGSGCGSCRMLIQEIIDAND